MAHWHSNLPGARQVVFPPAPPRTVREVLPHTALHRSFTRPLGGWESASLAVRSSLLGWFGHADTHRTERLTSHGPTAGPSLGEGSVVRSPGNGTMPRSDALSVGLHPAEEGLSSSPLDYPCIPRPLPRRVLGGCASQGFTPSVAFAHLRGARLPLGPAHAGGITGRQTSRDAADCRLACLPFRRLGQRASTAGFRPPPPLSYTAAGSLPWPDLHRQAQRGLSGHTGDTALRTGGRRSGR